VKFSIITPSFNQGRFIRDCIESVRSQTGVEWEHIIQDACSTDETHAVIAEYPHLKCVVEKDGGMSDGINRGFRRATGDWVMWLNTDDYLLPGTLAKVAGFAAQHPEADVIYGEAQFVKVDREFIRVRREHGFDFNTLLFYGCYIQSTATFLRRSIVTDGHLLDVRYRVCMDFDYYLRLSEAGYRFQFLPEPLAAFRWHGENTSLTANARRLEERLEIRRNYLKRHGRGWLGSTAMLALLMRVFQVRRIWLRRFVPPRQ
jgi:glycosyltransferase involved in cell wall biosynthesis